MCEAENLGGVIVIIDTGKNKVPSYFVGFAQFQLSVCLNKLLERGVVAKNARIISDAYYA